MRAEGLKALLAVHDLAAAHTLAVIEAVPEPALWDRAPGGRMKGLREQLIHLALVRESIARCLAGEETAGLGERFEVEPWTHGGTAELAEAFRDHATRCRHLLERLRDRDLDDPFLTRFGNRSTPRNYLRMMLLEETHHRAQMTCTLRLFGLEPPDYPGQAWVELGL
ncbi:MAG TPA: DinB family protein [Holophagaceae bacterium]|nr:DinB family protein [Holophagaceae bacterium]